MAKKVLFINQEIDPYVAETHMSIMGRELPQKMQEAGFEIRTFMPKWGTINERRGQLHEVIRLSGMNLITWKQLGLYLKPIIVLNTQHYYTSLLHQLQHAVDERFMRSEHSAIWHVADTPAEALQLAQTTPLWDKSVRKFAAM